MGTPVLSAFPLGSDQLGGSYWGQFGERHGAESYHL